jgi:hypothetical protein
MLLLLTLKRHNFYKNSFFAENWAFYGLDPEQEPELEPESEP